MRKWLKTGLAVCLTAALISGCGIGQGKPEEKEPTTLKVMYHDEGSFFSNYGMLYSALNEHVDIQVVSTNQIYNNHDYEKDGPIDYQKAVEELIEKEQPDILMLDSQQITAFAEEGRLYDIENKVNEADYNAAGLVPGLIDGMKALGNGSLYGIPLEYYSQVIFYNKDMFDQYNVPYPTDQMTWDEVIALANMFPTEGTYPDRVYGLKMGWSSGVADIVNVLMSSEGLTPYTTDPLQMTIDTPSWQSLLDRAVEYSKSDALFFDSYMYNDQGYISYDGDYYSNEPFFSNKIAMRLDGNYLMEELKNLKTYAQNPENLIQNWDIVTAPVNSSNPDESGYVNYYNILAINSKSTNIEQAWDFMAYITGDDYARVKAKTNNYGTVLRTAYIGDGTERNYGAFYKLRPNTSSYTSIDYNKVPERFQMEYYTIFYDELGKLERGEATSAEVLATLQIKGDELLASGEMTEEERQQLYAEQEARWQAEYGSEGIIVDDAAQIDIIEESTEEIVE